MRKISQNLYKNYIIEFIKEVLILMGKLPDIENGANASEGQKEVEE